MKNLTWLMLLLGILSLSSGSPRAWAQSGITAQNGRNVTCASDDGKRHLCRVDTSRGRPRCPVRRSPMSAPGHKGSRSVDW
jgi:hypothetical protein